LDGILLRDGEICGDPTVEHQSNVWIIIVGMNQMWAFKDEVE